MPLVVQKYGGTSLGNAERLQNVAHIIANTVKQHKVIVVVSAMSSYTKAEGTTSRLLEAGNLAINGGPFFRVLDLVEQSHFKALEEAISDTVIMEEVKEYIHEELRSLKAFLEAIHVIHEISPRSQDLIIGTGERLSARLLSGVLKSYGIDSTYTDLSQCVEENLSPNNGEFYSLCQQAFRKKLPENQNDVPVITGFFGFVSGGIINRIGRGYSDLTAALIAAEMQAEELQVWKEVDGIFSADPRKVPTASVLDAISPSEA
ncbi:MAG TPA: aspartate kinase, partial [SAR324 cluster bacterium]|nr:aspartate kinase [SAR324 cluster bacterium]